jgi:hypothetical protein
LLLLLACMDYNAHTWEDANQPVRDPPALGEDSADPAGHADDSGHGDDSDPPNDTQDPPDSDNPPEWDPPETWVDGCEEGEEATSGPAIYVLSWDPTYAEGSLTAADKGWYHVYSDQIMESGASQRNESAFFRLPNAGNPGGLPLHGNCGDDWIVQDSDNSGWPSGSKLYIGTFWLEAGANKLEMRHYCPVYRGGSCQGFHDGSDATCDSSNVNSVHYEGWGTCLRKAD